MGVPLVKSASFDRSTSFGFPTDGRIPGDAACEEAQLDRHMGEERSALLLNGDEVFWMVVTTRKEMNNCQGWLNNS